MGIPRSIGRLVRVVLVGGGHSHEQVVQKLTYKSFERAKGGNDIELVMISDGKRAMYSGMVPGVVAGQYEEKEASVDIEQLCQRNGWRFIQGRVEEIKATRQRLRVGEQWLDYDLLSVDVGSETKSIQGTLEALTHGARITKTRPILDLNERIDISLKSVGQKESLCIIVVGGGAAGCEIAFSLREKVHSSAKVSLVTSDVARLGSFAYKRASQAVVSELNNQDIELIEAQVLQVGVNKIYLKDGRSKAYDMLIMATGAQGPWWLRENCDIPLDERGFIQVNHALQSPKFPTIFAAGDCAAHPDKPPKAGVFAVRMGPILAHNLQRCSIALLDEGSIDSAKLKEFVPQKDILSLLAMGKDFALGSKWGLVFRGRWVRSLKDYIDRSWISRFEYSDNDSSPQSGTFSGSEVEGAAKLLGADVLTDEFEEQFAIIDRMGHDEAFREGVLRVADREEKAY
eukprot:Plantae.Rhodophyta-Purpureofilum_apyrenoidigerum.ctg14361.p1 GENE.Plantae.Rhodophyta-Purpureofilum_apyrenoidigerum.ctg14361~~Plantae.Rhodophyta-Purpureofilum_apyrenoidigerum.ctg14361.p1  ORF type:complete len:457 (+),score=71.13 Plantae.Rhodophyta-Purpureofilum_apyrenoidigerum.ctg14361:285-1655(+)